MMLPRDSQQLRRLSSTMVVQVLLSIRTLQANAVVKIAGVVSAAAVVTWFGVPLMIAAVKMIW